MFDWYDYYDLAEELSQESSEAHQRSAVSRVYYALYCNARNGLLLRGEWNPEDKSSKESDHTYLWNKYGLGPDKERKKIGELGHRLRESRRQADYDDYIENRMILVTKSMSDAEKLKDRLQGL